MKLKLRAPSSGQCGFRAGVRFSAVIAGKPSLSLRGVQYPITLSLRGSRATWQSVSSPPVIARSEATWQSVLLLVAGTKSLRGKGKRIAAPVCALARNDRWGEGGRVGLPLSLRGSGATWQSVSPPPVIARSEATWQSVLLFGAGTKSLRCKGERIAAPVCALARNDRWGKVCALVLRCHCGEAPSLSLRGKPFSVIAGKRAAWRCQGAASVDIKPKGALSFLFSGRPSWRGRCV